MKTSSSHLVQGVERVVEFVGHPHGVFWINPKATEHKMEAAMKEKTVQNGVYKRRSHEAVSIISENDIALSILSDGFNFLNGLYGGNSSKMRKKWHKKEDCLTQLR